MGCSGIGGLAIPTTTTATAGINNTMNFQGRLLSASGAVVADGNYNMEFRIYQDGAGTAAYNGGTYGSPTGLDWSEDWLDSNSQGVVVKNGYFSVNLGTICSLSGSTCQGVTNAGVNWNDNTLWLSMDVAGLGEATASCGATQALFHQTWNGTNGCSADGEMLPMKSLSTSPYAENAGELGGLTSAGFIQNQTTGAQAASYWIQGTAQIAPTTSAVNALSVTGTTGATAATAAVIGQGGAADGEDINVSNGSSTAGSALAITKTGAGTLNYGISFTGATGTADIYRGSGNLVVAAASGNITLSPSTGTVTITGTTPTVTSSGATNLAVDTGGAATLNLGTSNATTINIGHSTASGTLTLQGGTASTSISLSNAAGGMTVFSGTAPASTGSAGTAASSLLSGTGAVGGATTGRRGGAGGGITLTTGAGGAATGRTGISNVGGAGGAFNISAGNGGAASGLTSGTGGAGGNIVIAAGSGGVSTTGTNAGGGNITLQGGANGTGGTGGTAGQVLVKNASNSASGFQVQNASAGS